MAPGGAAAGRLLALAARLEAIVASPDGTTLYGAPRLDLRDAGGGRVVVLDVASGKERGALLGSESAPLSLALDREGKRLLAGYADGTAVVWDADVT